MYPIKAKFQNYAWGRRGLNSTVAQLYQATGGEVDENKPYAELWMGTHVNGPSEVEVEGEWKPLSTIVEGGKLPFLFKVLSVNKALSIQAHPDKKLAKKLHSETPQIYKDDNHKPEMAIALTEFEALVGFRQYEDIFKNIEDVPELSELLKNAKHAVEYKKIDNPQEKLKYLFSKLMMATKFKALLESLSLRINAKQDKTKLDNLVLRLTEEYPGDIGIFCVYFLNYKTLQPGEAIFLGANEPHAYLHGDCAEIMASSDNVVRAGLTPKLRDVDTLCSMLTYNEFDEDASFLPGKPLDNFSKYYAPNTDAVDEFELIKVEIGSKSQYVLDVASYDSILLVLNGSCVLNGVHELARGSIYFLKSAVEAKVVVENSVLFLRASKKGSLKKITN